MVLFEEYTGNFIGLKTNKNHRVFRWRKKDCKILFSVTRQGSVASCHFASDKKGLRRVRQAINEFCYFCFKVFEWCKKIIAKINISSVERLVGKCGFVKVYENQNASVWAKEK